MERVIWFLLHGFYHFYFAFKVLVLSLLIIALLHHHPSAALCPSVIVSERFSRQLSLGLRASLGFGIGMLLSIVVLCLINM